MDGWGFSGPLDASSLDTESWLAGVDNNFTLTGNEFDSDMPTELCNLAMVANIDLSNNVFRGIACAWSPLMASAIRKIDLSFNQV